MDWRLMREYLIAYLLLQCLVVVWRWCGGAVMEVGNIMRERDSGPSGPPVAGVTSAQPQLSV